MSSTQNSFFCWYILGMLLSFTNLMSFGGKTLQDIAVRGNMKFVSATYDCN
jgi:hypothetical protein